MDYYIFEVLDDDVIIQGRFFGSVSAEINVEGHKKGFYIIYFSLSMFEMKRPRIKWAYIVRIKYITVFVL